MYSYTKMQTGNAGWVRGGLKASGPDPPRICPTVWELGSIVSSVGEEWGGMSIGCLNRLCRRRRAPAVQRVSICNIN
ncbi:hypothetical protein SCLCIDRAFT_1063485 [Scleroderma citrinum Foug A]|uniref:Uncharacterized protein n=1 Tax=Scleroderma citrinum Foug A TaxID=1036808 RepID=A0A0C3ARV1_9AGAM|nr:hypothetical protein SCLCIDRAFT_1063485 [Scleroderma citrinum Foug A]